MLAISVIAAGLDGEPRGAYLSVNLSPRTLETDQFRAPSWSTLFSDTG